MKYAIRWECGVGRGWIRNQGWVTGPRAFGRLEAVVYLTTHTDAHREELGPTATFNIVEFPTSDEVWKWERDMKCPDCGLPEGHTFECVNPDNPNRGRGRVSVVRKDAASAGTCQCCSVALRPGMTVLEMNFENEIGQGWVSRLCDNHLRQLFIMARRQGWELPR